MITKLNLMFTTPRSRRIFCSFLLMAAVITVLIGISSLRATDQPGSSSQNASAKIAPWVIEHTENAQQAEFIVVLADQADLTRAAEMTTKAAKGRFVRDALWKDRKSTRL